jgi:ABC-type transport system substrate-binding protein
MRFKTTRGDLAQDGGTPPNWSCGKRRARGRDHVVFTLRDDTLAEPAAGERSPVTGEDVVYSFNRYREISPNKANLGMVDSVTAEGNVVTFKLTEPFGLFLNRIASFQDLWIMPKEFIEESETASGDRMLGSGLPHLRAVRAQRRHVLAQEPRLL